MDMGSPEIEFCTEPESARPVSAEFIAALRARGVSSGFIDKIEADAKRIRLAELERLREEQTP